jgi:hypothetical protein
MKRSPDDRQGPTEIPALIGLPLLLIAGLVSIPVIPVLWAYYTVRETHFARRMKLAGRGVSEPEWAAALENRRGTLIEEWFSEKGPVRYWWTEDDIPSVAPFAWTASGFEASIDREYDEFALWCHTNYFANNKARFVSGSYERNRMLPSENPGAAIAIPVVAIYKGRFSPVFQGRPLR